MKKQFTTLFLVTFILHSVFSQTVIRGPYLQSLTPTSIKVKWRTSAATDSRVNYGTDSLNLSLSVDVAGSFTDHTVQLSNLQPYTTYYYSVGSSSQVLSGPSALHHFKTAPVTGTEQPYRFWAIGDFGKNNQGQKDVRDSYVSLTGSNHVDMWLWLGDCAYDNGTDAEYQTKVFDVYADIMKYMPFYPAPGNHDYGSVCAIPCFTDPATHSGPYLDIIDVPKNGEAGGVPSGYELYYSFDYGNVHFISLNSELGSLIGGYDWNGVYSASNFNGSPAQQWLVNDLTANTLPWVVVYFHQPPYTDGSHHSDDVFELYMAAMRNNYNPIFQQFGVDIVLCGHSHVFERSYLLKGQFANSSAFDINTHAINSTSGKYSLGEPYVKYTTGPNINEGTVYVVNGNSGSREQGAPLNYPAFYYDDDGYGSFMMEVNGNRLDGKYLNDSGAVLDEFTILKMPYAILSDVSVSICQGESYFAGGADQTVSGTYYDTIPAVSGMDTIRVTTLSVNPLIPVITQQANMLSVPAAYVSYQWYKDNIELPGDTLPSLQAAANGDYFVMVADTEGCNAYSDTISFVVDGINDLESAGVQLLPNPVTDDLLIIFSKVIQGDLHIEVYNAEGKKVISSDVPVFNGNQQSVKMASLMPGVYLIRVHGESVNFTGSVVRR